jgi:hypothetical protein
MGICPHRRPEPQALPEQQGPPEADTTAASLQQKKHSGRDGVASDSAQRRQATACKLRVTFKLTFLSNLFSSLIRLMQGIRDM